MLERTELQTLCSTLWTLVRRTVGYGDYAKSPEYDIHVDRVEEILTVYQDKRKVIGYNSERGVVNWYGNQNDFDKLWLIIANHDDMFGHDWYEW